MRHGVFIDMRRKQRNFMNAKVHRLIDEGGSYRTLCGKIRSSRIIFVKDDSLSDFGRCLLCFSEAADQRVEAVKSAERLMSRR